MITSKALELLTTDDIIDINKRCKCEVDLAVIQRYPISGDVIATCQTCADFIDLLEPEADHIVPLIKLYSSIAHIQINRCLPRLVLADEWLTTTEYFSEGPKFKQNNITEMMIPHMKGYQIFYI